MAYLFHFQIQQSHSGLARRIQPMLSPEEQEVVDGLCQKYKGHLSLVQLAEGIVACIGNADQLYDDGLALLNANRYPRALSLFIAAMEELGKVSVLCSMCRIPTNNQALWADFWSDFRSHENKSTRAFIHAFPDESRRFPELMGAAANMQFELAPLSERLRQAGLYVDFLADNKQWMTPSDLPRSEAESWRRRIESALSRVRHQAGLGLFSQRALEIQREVYGPVNALRPRRKDAKIDDDQSIVRSILVAHRVYYRRLVEECILDRDADIQVMGIALAQFIADQTPDCR
jgi:AbiV family abortive infection protein